MVGHMFSFSFVCLYSFFYKFPIWFWERNFAFHCSSSCEPVSGLIHFTMQTYPCNLHPLTPHFYIVKLGFTGVYISFLFLLLKINCGYSLEPPQRTKNLYFEQKYENNQKISTENGHFYSSEKVQYIAWACFLNVKLYQNKVFQYYVTQKYLLYPIKHLLILLFLTKTYGKKCTPVKK